MKMNLLLFTVHCLSQSIFLYYFHCFPLFITDHCSLQSNIHYYLLFIKVQCSLLSMSLFITVHRSFTLHSNGPSVCFLWLKLRAIIISSSCLELTIASSNTITAYIHNHWYQSCVTSVKSLSVSVPTIETIRTFIKQQITTIDTNLSYIPLTIISEEQTWSIRSFLKQQLLGLKLKIKLLCYIKQIIVSWVILDHQNFHETAKIVWDGM